MILKGRKVIKFDVRSEDLTDVNILTSVLNNAMGIHLQNKSEIDYLMDYHKGIQPVLQKEKDIRAEINNKLVLNHAQMITRTIVGYFLGNPIQYIPSGVSNKKHLIDELNIYTQYENKPTVDKILGEHQSICGTAYRIIYKDGDFSGRADGEVPFEDRNLDPATTFVVYESNISGKPLIGATYYSVTDSENRFKGRRIYAYTDFGRYEFLSSGTNPLTPDNLVEFLPYQVGGIPIIEYPNNIWRIGDWELVIGLMNEINDFNSGRLDDIDQVIQSLLVFVNAELDGEAYDEMREKGVIMLTSTENNRSDVKTIVNSLDQNGMSSFAEELTDLLYKLVGIPNRSGSISGGDTGLAVELREGWADLETIAKNKEQIFMESEKRTLDILLYIFNMGRTEKLKKLDLDIKFSRNKNNNMLVKTQSYQTLLSTNTLTPQDCLTIVDLVSDANDYIERGQQFWEDNFARKLDKQPMVEEKIDNKLKLSENSD